MVKKITAFIVFMIGILFLGIRANASQKALEQQSVLFISSYSQSWHNTTEQLNGILNSINPNVIVDTFYMDTKNVKYDNQYEQNLYNQFYKRHQEIQNYNAIITGDDTALNFVYKYHDELFTDKYVIFEGVNDLQNASQISESEYFFGVCEKVNYQINIEFALSLIKDATKGNIIYDGTIGGIGEYEQFYSEASLYKNIEFNYVNTSNYTKAELQDVFSKFGQDEINIFLIMSECKDGTITPEESIEFVKGINAPVFRVNEVGGDSVFLGGYLYSHYFAGQLTGSMVNILLNNDRNVDELHVNFTAAFECKVNYEVLKKYGFTVEMLPKDVILLDYNVSFFDHHKKIIIASALLAIAVIAVISLLIRLVLKYYRQNQKLKYMNTYDSSTGLLSKTTMQKHVTKHIDEKTPFALLVIDIDNFKIINDYYGHKSADAFIEELGKCYSRLAGDDIKLYRFGGDEYAAIILSDDIVYISKIADKLLRINNNVIKVYDHNISFSVSIGIALYPCHATDNFTLFAAADSAMYYIKDSVKNNYALYDSSIMYDLKVESTIVEKLKSAVEEDKIYMLYQPIFNTKKQKIDGAEALMRIKDFEYGPDKFIPAAEKSGFMISLGRFATKEAIKTLREIKDLGIKDFHISVNFSGAQLSDSTYLQYVCDLLDEYNVSRDSFNLEFTESINVMDDKLIENFFLECNRLGIKILLDDFGCGYSSIYKLNQYEYSTVKFDKEITSTMFNKRSFAALLAYCHSFNYPVVAEGVEDEKQFKHLNKLGVEYIQGYYIYRPLSLEVLKEEISKNS